ncbi:MULTISPECIES: hypothetical protein [unclassified Ensifer]|uniref:hypothetical protein n=1 Tax=unclassified Ensifer TaxID=2633371 RepID=UPI0008137E3F|nr:MULTISPECIES: hypothetical protein [unclassified Ensifer]OCP16439.1 hypothetical protein BC361_10895 [Ensifer sp. LC54]OCP20369.1 hypothetical protein BC363_06000 [Ensifer sp. LC384]
MIGRNGIFADAGPYWTLPLPINKLELHPALRQEIEGRKHRRAFEAYLLMIFDETSAPPSGILEIALNRREKCACAIYEARRVSRPLSRRFECSHETIVDQGKNRSACGEHFLPGNCQPGTRYLIASLRHR